VKIISLFNFKNGVGKTTIGFNLAKHLSCEFIECIPLYFEEELNITDKCVYDINTKDIKKINKVLKKSDYIIIPTELDFKVLIDTIISIKYASKTNSKARIIVAFNRLHTHNKKSELPYTKKAEKFIKKNINNIELEFIYIRDNKLWYKNFIIGKFYLDEIVNQDAFEYFYKQGILDIYGYFNNNNILEIL